ncbi:tetratricopeptide repeat-containing sensor histidine kinase [Rufibacter sp. LB8]|uniref:tetratricopeptide repeat-containing sensor histidine kinase n=1 Tax=Rufibacter sp. LB8 TaxID=2777781 RepID=UPI00178C6309|nr:tetratricopeptide repeat-containing sensor histidine kinase [Rufibacter sp. LB8]
MRIRFLILFFLPGLGLAQNPIADSLQLALANATTDTARIRLHCELGRHLVQTDLQASDQHAAAAEKLSIKNKFLSGQARALNLFANNLLVRGEFDQALAKYYQALKIGQQTKDTLTLFATYNGLGVLSYKTKDETRALLHYQSAFDLALKSNNRLNQSKVYNNLGNIFETKGNYQKALAYFKKSEAIQRATPDKKSWAISLLNLGNVYTLMQQPQKGLPFLYKALEVDQAIGNKMNQTVTLVHLAKAYRALQNLPKALVYAEQGYAVAHETKSSKKIIAAAKVLQELHEVQKNYQQAYVYQGIVKDHEDRLDLENQSVASSKIVARFEAEKHELENQKLKAEQERQAIALQLQKDTMWLEGGLILLMFVLLGVSFLSRRQLRRAYLQLREAHQQMQAQNLEISTQKEEISKQSAILKTQNLQLERHNNAKNKIFSIVAHDLRSPFTTIKGALDLAQGHPLSDQDIKRIFGVLSKDVEVVMAMMDNLLIWSRSQMEGTTLQVQTLELSTATDATLDLMAILAAKKGVSLTSTIETSLLVQADKERLSFVLRNLLMNALKFSFEGGQIQVFAKKEMGQVLLSVQDQGKGISEKHLAKIFSGARFTTLGTAQEAGTGLGLMLCKELMESMAGSISVASHEGKGSTFTISLPLVEGPPVSEKSIPSEVELVLS